MKKRFSVPATYNVNHIPIMKNLGVTEVYGSLGNQFFPSARITSELRKPSLKNLDKYFSALRKSGIAYSFILNSPKYSLNKNSKKLRSLVRFLRVNNVGSIVLADMSLIDYFIKEIGPERIKISVVAEVDSLKKAMVYKQKGIMRIAVDPSINRNYKLLSKLKAEGFLLTVLLNECCAPSCKYRRRHYEHISREKSGSDIFRLWCMCSKAYNRNHDVGTWIRPEELMKYNKLNVDKFKLSGREYSDDWILNALKSYHSGDYNCIMDILTGSKVKRNNHQLGVLLLLPSSIVRFLLQFYNSFVRRKDVEILLGLKSHELKSFLRFLNNSGKIQDSILGKIMNTVEGFIENGDKV